MSQEKFSPKVDINHHPCKLCLENKKMIKAHIIPDFLYQDLYDKKHMISVALARDIILRRQNIYNKFQGEYDSNILCQQCDNEILGKYESYANEYFYNTLKNRIENSNKEDLDSIIVQLEYKRFKLFLLSILWRASVTKRPLFQNVHLGPHEENIRKMLFYGDPKESSDYPTILLTYLNDQSFPKDLIAEPAAIKNNSGKGYIFIISGIVYVFYMSKPTIDDFVLRHTIKDNQMPLLLIPKGQMKGFIRKYFGITK